MENKGYIYILTNPSFPDYVKIGYADNVEQRLAELNRTPCTPFAFRVYATYQVNSRLTDMKIHDMIGVFLFSLMQNWHTMLDERICNSIKLYRKQANIAYKRLTNVQISVIM